MSPASTVVIVLKGTDQYRSDRPRVFHREGCPSLTRNRVGFLASRHKTTRALAVAEGRTACKRCKP